MSNIKRYGNGWEQTKLGNLGTFIRGRGIPKRDLREEGVPCILYGEIYTTYNTFTSKLKSRSKIENLEKSPQIKFGDILFATSGETRDEIGKHVMYLGEETAIAGGDILVFRPKDEIKNLAYSYVLETESIRKQKFQLAEGHSVVHLYQEHLSNLKVPLIPKDEQQKIASILSTWDEAIEKYQNFLELIKLEKEGIAHRAIVQNAPQIGGYRKYKIGEILTYEQPQKYLENDISEEKEKDTVPVLTANKAFVLGYSKNLEGTYHEYPAIIFDDFTTDIKYVDFEFKVRSSAIKILSAKSDDINLKYVYETMNLIRFPLGGHKRHYISEYQYIKVGLPPKEYQDKIANLLTNMDEKIKLIDSMIENLKEQKRGLMQLLLTGKVRVWG